MDVVYILGKGSLCGDEEIRYSLRALELNMLDLGRVFIIGEKPEFLQNVEHIHVNDSMPYKHMNAYNKVLRACMEKEISAEFLLMNDDFFITEPFSGAEWPFYALKGSNGGACGPVSFHIHAPIRINKEWYQKMPLDLSFKTCKSPRTFYSNFYKAPPKYCDDFIIRAGEGCKDFNLQVKGKPCFSICDDAMLYNPFRAWLNVEYPNPSRFEKLL